MPDIPPLAFEDVWRLSAHELQRLVAQLLATDGASVELGSGVGEPRADIIVRTSHGNELWEVQRLVPRASRAQVEQTFTRVETAMASVDEPSAVGIVFAAPFTTAAALAVRDLEADFRRRHPSVRLNVVDAHALLAWIRRAPAAYRSFFPSPAAGPTDRAGRLAAASAAPAIRLTGPWSWLLALLLVFAVIAIPSQVSPAEGRFGAAVVIGLYALLLVATVAAAWAFGETGESRDPLSMLLFSVPDAAAIRRRLLSHRPPASRVWFGACALAVRRPLRVLVSSFVLAFFAFWTSLYLLLWGLSPMDCADASGACSGAFTGFGVRPAVGDFLFFVINATFFNQPPELNAASRVAHAMIAAQFLSAATFLTTYAVYFGLDKPGWWRR